MELDIKTLLILIPAFPLAAALLTAALGKRVLRGRSHLPTIIALALSCAASVLLVFAVQDVIQPSTGLRGKEGPAIGYESIVTLWTWAAVDDAQVVPLSLRERAGVRESLTVVTNRTAKSSTGSPHPGPLPEGEGDLRLDAGGSSPHPNLSPKGEGTGRFHIDVVLRADPLTAVMLAMVTFISLLVAVYSIGYMHGDPGYWRFFTYIPLFVFSMTMLVSASNFVLLYVFWEAVGLCSYLLIGFWFQKPAAAAAGLKAFLVNRVGDFGFALGVFLLWITYGTLDFHDTIVGGVVHRGILGQTMLGNPSLYVGGGVGTAICLLLLLGACGKSAQFPLHVWLPDAMEGPTPVSALIHAATMVTAGVYMVARCTPLFVASPDAQRVVAVVGGFTAIMAALIALTQNDLKRILAYSTISQLGYMFLGLGAGTLLGISAAMFHLMTHAFFKALLFLGAGSVMHAMGGVVDVRRFGGLRRRLPTTHWTFLIGCLALAGVFPFAGFWSKDEILVAVWRQASAGPAPQFYRLLYLAAVATAFLTAFYAFRAMFLTFYGPERIPEEAGGHAHEAPATMTGPLVILAFGAAAVGGYFFFTGDFTSPHGFLAQTPSLAYARMAAAAGGEEGFHWHVAATSTAVALAGVFLAAFLYLGARRTVERLTQVAKGLGLYGLSQRGFFCDEIYLALIVWPLRGLAWVSAWFDRRVIDGLVDFLGLLPRALGAALRPTQGGMIQFYALAMALGLLLLIGSLWM